MQESQIDTSTTERQLLYDIRSEMRRTNELLSALIEKPDMLPSLLDVLNPIAKGLEQKGEVKQKVTKPKTTTKPKTDKPKRGNKDAKNQ